MTDKVYLHYTQAELDRNFDQRNWVKNALEIIGRYPELSKATRARLKHYSAAYGSGPDETLDIFPAAKSPAPVQVFVHGGAWKNFTKDDYSFPADAYVPAGIPTGGLNFFQGPAGCPPPMGGQGGPGTQLGDCKAARLCGGPQRVFPP